MIFTKATMANVFEVTVIDKNSKVSKVLLRVDDYTAAETKAKLLLDATLSEKITQIVLYSSVITDVTP